MIDLTIGVSVTSPTLKLHSESLILWTHLQEFFKMYGAILLEVPKKVPVDVFVSPVICIPTTNCPRLVLSVQFVKVIVFLVVLTGIGEPGVKAS